MVDCGHFSPVGGQQGQSFIAEQETFIFPVGYVWDELIIRAAGQNC